MGPARHQMINFMVYCTTGTAFIESINISGHTKDPFPIMDQMVKLVGANFIFQIATDNEATFKAADGREASGTEVPMYHLGPTRCTSNWFSAPTHQQDGRCMTPLKSCKTITGLIHTQNIVKSKFLYFLKY